jgi:malate synthase
VIDEAATPVDSTGVLTDEARQLVGILHRVHGHALRGLLQQRAARMKAGLPGFAQETARIREGHWAVAPAPPDLADRRVEITGPVERKLMRSALRCGARVFMADFEDALSPTWTNVIEGHRNVAAAADESIGDGPDGERATLTVRPRGLHLPEPRVLVDGQPVAASLFDAALLAMHAAPSLAARGSGLYLYLPKMESHHEAQWWDAVLVDLERRVGLQPESIRVTVLIETLPAAFQMDEILYALRGRITGLNAGRWDYLFSLIKHLGHRTDHLLPDRSQLTMQVPFLAAYAERLVETCHRRGAHAIGGMAAFIPNRRDPERNARALAEVRSDKEREAALGYDGTWVAHPDLVPVAMEVFDRTLGVRADQRSVRHGLDANPATLLDTSIEGGKVTPAGVRTNVGVTLQYLEAWLGGKGAVAINDLMEDAATAEISRCQLWQWVRHGLVSRADIRAVMEDEQARLLGAGHDPDRLKLAASLLTDASLCHELPPFLTLLALDYLP